MWTTQYVHYFVIKELTSQHGIRSQLSVFFLLKHIRNQEGKLMPVNTQRAGNAAMIYLPSDFPMIPS